jgi:hypothetical protein
MTTGRINQVTIVTPWGRPTRPLQGGKRFSYRLGPRARRLGGRSGGARGGAASAVASADPIRFPLLNSPGRGRQRGGAAGAGPTRHLGAPRGGVASGFVGRLGRARTPRGYDDSGRQSPVTHKAQPSGSGTSSPAPFAAARRPPWAEAGGGRRGRLATLAADPPAHRRDLHKSVAV